MTAPAEVEEPKTSILNVFEYLIRRVGYHTEALAEEHLGIVREFIDKLEGKADTTPEPAPVEVPPAVSETDVPPAVVSTDAPGTDSAQ